MDFKTLIEAVDQLPKEELERLRKHIDQRYTAVLLQQKPRESVEERLRALHEATANFFEGYSQEEVDEIIEAMNSEYVDPDDVRAS